MTAGQKRSFKALTGISFVGFLALIAAQGKAFFEALEAMPRVLTAFSDALPGGSASFFLVLLVSGVCWYIAQRVLIKPTLKPTHGNEFTAELLAIVAAQLAMLALNLTSPLPEGMTYAGSIVKAIMLGLLAGFAAPFLAKGLLGLGRVIKAQTIGEDAE